MQFCRYRRGVPVYKRRRQHRHGRQGTWTDGSSPGNEPAQNIFHILIVIWFGDTVTVSHFTKLNSNSKVQAISHYPQPLLNKLSKWKFFKQGPWMGCESRGDVIFFWTYSISYQETQNLRNQPIYKICICEQNLQDLQDLQARFAHKIWDLNCYLNGLDPYGISKFKSYKFLPSNLTSY